MEINEEVREEWKEEKSTFQRVKSVVSREYDGKTAGEISEEALVAESTARSKLEELVDEGFVEKTSDPESGAALYKRSWESLVFEQAKDMADHADTETLMTKIQEMQREIEEYREETGVDSPEDIAWSESEIDRETILEWKTTRRNLSFAKVALTLDQAGEVVGKPTKV